MNLDDLNEAPMGMLNRLGQKVLSKIPGSIGAKAQGKLDTGKVANQWEKEYMTYLGRVGQKNPSTETLAGFLKTKGFSDDDLKDVIGESALVYERVISGRELDSMILKAAQRAAGGGSKSASQASSSPSSVQTRQEPQVPPPGIATAQPPAKPAVPSKPAAKQIPQQQKQTPDSGANNYLNSWAKSIRTAVSSADKMKLAQEMIKFIGDRQGTPQGKMLAKAAEMVIKRLGDPQVAKVIGGLKKFQMERANYAIASYILSEMGLTWKDINMKIVLSESTSNYVTIAYR